MMHRNQSSKVAPLVLLTAALLLAPDQADAGQYPSLCNASSNACSFTGPVAPVLRADVCWDRVAATLKGAGDCPTGSWPYYVDFGEVIDPILGVVVGYAPLADACDMGMCITTPPVGPLEAEALCCNGLNNCNMQVQGCGGAIVYCEQAATNDDGTLSCHDNS